MQNIGSTVRGSYVLMAQLEAITGDKKTDHFLVREKLHQFLIRTQSQIFTPTKNEVQLFKVTYETRSDLDDLFQSHFVHSFIPRLVQSVLKFNQTPESSAEPLQSLFKERKLHERPAWNEGWAKLLNAVLIKEGISIEEFRQVEERKLHLILERCAEVLELVQAGASLREFISLDEKTSQCALQLFERIVDLVENGTNLSTILTKQEPLFSFIMENSFNMAKFIQCGVSLDRILAVEKSRLIEVLGRSFTAVYFLVSKGMSFEYLCSLDSPNFFNIVFTQCVPVATLFNSQIPSEEFYNVNPSRVLKMALYPGEIRRLREAGASFALLASLEDSLFDLIMKNCFFPPDVKNPQGRGVVTLMARGITLEQICAIRSEDMRRYVIEQTKLVNALLDIGMGFEAIVHSQRG